MTLKETEIILIETEDSTLSDIESIICSDYGKYTNLRHMDLYPMSLDITKHVLLQTTNKSTGETYKVIVLFTASGVYYTTSVSFIENFATYAKFSKTGNLRIRVDLKESAKRRGEKFLDCMLDYVAAN